MKRKLLIQIAVLLLLSSCVSNTYNTPPPPPKKSKAEIIQEIKNELKIKYKGNFEVLGIYLGMTRNDFEIALKIKGASCSTEYSSNKIHFFDLLNSEQFDLFFANEVRYKPLVAYDCEVTNNYRETLDVFFTNINNEDKIYKIIKTNKFERRVNLSSIKAQLIKKYGLPSHQDNIDNYVWAMYWGDFKYKKQEKRWQSFIPKKTNPTLIVMSKIDGISGDYRLEMVLTNHELEKYEARYLQEKILRKSKIMEKVNF